MTDAPQPPDPPPGEPRPDSTPPAAPSAEGAAPPPPPPAATAPPPPAPPPGFGATPGNLAAGDNVARVRNAYTRRHESDYILEFWSALGWTILTCGIYGFYVLYQLVRRSRDHNARRLEELDAATAVAWAEAERRGLTEELKPQFDSVAGNLAVLRAMTSDFREPLVWVLLSIVTGIATYIAFILLDGDRVKHDYHEGAVENDLATIYTRLGAPLTGPDPSRLQGKHNYVGRIIATLVTCGVYGLWWYYNMMDDLNRHFRANWAWEDELANAVQAVSGTAA